MNYCCKSLLQDSSSLVVDHTRYTFDAAATSNTTYVTLRDSLNVITENFAMISLARQYSSCEVVFTGDVSTAHPFPSHQGLVLPCLCRHQVPSHLHKMKTQCEQAATRRAHCWGD
jgi:hypothetical protein